jgi:hypothetical protein
VATLLPQAPEFLQRRRIRVQPISSRPGSRRPETAEDGQPVRSILGRREAAG